MVGGDNAWKWIERTAAVVGATATIIFFIQLISERSYEPTAPSGFTRLLWLALIGIGASVVHAALWTLSERRFGWTFGSGGGEALPAGWQAVLLSVTMTVPLVLAIPLIQLFFPISFFQDSQTLLLSGAGMILGGAVGHLILYGDLEKKYFLGIRNLVSPVDRVATLSQALEMELIYAIIHFVTMVGVFQTLLWYQGKSDLSIVLQNTLICGALFFVSGVAFILIVYPQSLRDKTWIQVRGTVLGAVLHATLLWGMLT